LTGHDGSKVLSDEPAGHSSDDPHAEGHSLRRRPEYPPAHSDRDEANRGGEERAVSGDEVTGGMVERGQALRLPISSVGQLGAWHGAGVVDDFELQEGSSGP
jgi:hypothetical protein